MSEDQTLTLSAKPHILIGMATIVVLVGGLFYWAATATITGAVIAQGTVEVEHNRQIVQHPTRGVATEVYVRDGQYVAQGDVLVLLDTSRQQGEWVFAQAQLFELEARQDRLKSEQSELEAVDFNPALLGQSMGNPALRALLDGQRALFQATRRSIAIESTKLKNRKQQITAQINGIDAQEVALTRQLELLAQELDAQRALRARKLTSAGAVITLERQEASLSGSLGETLANRTAAVQRLMETDLELVRLRRNHLEKSVTTARDLDAPIRQYRRDLGALRDEIAQARIRAPVSGIVYGMTLGTAREVLRPAEPLLYLIPQDRPLIVAMRVSPRHIDQVVQGQNVKLRLSAMDQRLTPELWGQITRISADAIADDAGGQAYYRAEMVLPAEELQRLPHGARLLPGMPVEAFIRTGERSPMAYMVKPMTDYFARAFRES